MIGTFRLATMGVALATLGACVHADQPALSLEARQALQLASVEVGFAPGASVHVSAVEDEAIRRGATTREQVAEVEMAHIKQVMVAEFRSTLAPQLAGTRPVVAKITIQNFDIPGALAAFMVGGSSQLAAGVDLVDVKTGAVLASVPPGQITSSVYRPGGVIGLAVQASAANDPAELKTREMAHAFAVEYGRWLAAS